MNCKRLENEIKKENEDFKKLMNSNNSILLDTYKILIKNDELFNRGKDFDLINKYNALNNKIYGGLK